MPKKIKKSKKVRKKSLKVLFKIKPLEWAKKVEKTTKPKKSRTRAKLSAGPKLVKQIEPTIYKTKIKILGIGGGGSSIVSEIAQVVKKTNFIAANINQQVSKEIPRNVKRFQFGQKLTQGLGTGMNPELGEQAAESEKEKIKELLKDTDFCILISCLGGGTGSGASPVFAEILKKLRILTLGIFTLSFDFEGKKRAEIAKDSLEKLKPNLNALIIIPNQKIFQIVDKNTPLKEALSVINRNLAESLEGLITLIYSPGLIQVDFADLKTILSGRRKLAYLNTAEAKNLDQIKELTEKILFNPLFPYSVKGAKEVLFNIDGGLNLNIEQVDQIGKTISNSINPQARVAFGITQNKKEEIKITLLANGCQWEEWEQEKEKPKKKPKEKQARSKQAPKPKKKVRKKTEEKLPELPKIQPPETTQISTDEPEKVEIKVRKNALDYNPPTTLPPEGRAPVKKAIQEEEKKILTQERKWETPAFLRRKSQPIEEESEN